MGNASNAKEIGSEFWISETKLNNTFSEVPYWLKRYGNVVFTSSGRGAISLLLEQVDVKVKRVLLPSYICDSVLLPFEDAGYELSYYDVDEYLRPVKNIRIESIGIFLHMGYFGFPTNKALDDLILELKSKSVIIIEDVTHTLLSNYEKKEYNDFVVGSIRKWFGIPSGGFLASKETICVNIQNPPEDFIGLRVASLKKKDEYIKTGNMALKDEFLSGFRRAEQMLNRDIKPYGIDKLSNSIIQNINVDEVRKIRKRNYEYLLDKLKGINNIKILFSITDDDNITPFFFPIYVKCDRDRLRSFLTNRNIYCPVHWPIPSKLSGKLSENLRWIYNSILSIPCDQRYNINDMSRIADAINKYYS